MFGFVRNLFGGTPAATSGRTLQMRKSDRMQAKYDAAQTNELNGRYWKNADSLSADSANDKSTRQTLRNRARYENSNNSFLRGMSLTLANDLIGRGPRLQMQTTDRDANRQIELAFHLWARQINLAAKLRTSRVAKVIDGEVFAMFTNNRRLPGVQLDLRLIEADQIATPAFSFNALNAVDGIEFDSDGNPTSYHLLRSHPGGINPFASMQADPVDAADMIHLFRADRPGQHRGIPEVTPALPLFALLRDYTLAVLSSARSAAKFTAILESDSSANDDVNRDPSVEAFDAVDIDYDMITAMPYGHTLKQFKPEQPVTTYDQFRDAILNEIARCLNMPFNIAAGNSSSYNYASGRLDHQMYFKSLDVERADWEAAILEPLLMRWLDEALFIPGMIPDDLGPFAALPHTWFWDGREHVDPAKEANGQKTRLSSGTTSRAREYGLAGLDIDTEDERAAEGFGVTVKEYRQALFASTFASSVAATDDADDEDEDEDDEDDKETDGDESKETAEAAATA